MIPPLLLRLLVRDGQKAKVNLWIPLVIIWLPLLAIVIILLPLILIFCVVTWRWRQGVGRGTLIGGWGGYRLCCAMRGLLVDVAHASTGERVIVAFW